MQFSRVAKDLAICLNSPIISSISSCDIIGFVSLRSMKISIQTIQRAPLYHRLSHGYRRMSFPSEGIGRVSNRLSTVDG